MRCTCVGSRQHYSSGRCRPTIPYRYCCYSYMSIKRRHDGFLYQFRIAQLHVSAYMSQFKRHTACHISYTQTLLITVVTGDKPSGCYVVCGVTFCLGGFPCVRVCVSLCACVCVCVCTLQEIFYFLWLKTKKRPRVRTKELPCLFSRRSRNSLTLPTTLSCLALHACNPMRGFTFFPLSFPFFYLGRYARHHSSSTPHH